MNPLKKICGTIVLGFVLAIVISVILPGEANQRYLWSLVVWLHVLAGITWIGLLYYFNFVQVAALNEAAADSDGPGPAAIAKYVAPRALWWFRWGALATWLTGASALQATSNTSIVAAFTLQSGSEMIGVGAWLGTIMLFNVWVLIWPNQKKVLGQVSATDEEKAKAKTIAFTASRINTLLSIPMLMCMVGHGHGLPIPF